MDLVVVMNAANNTPMGQPVEFLRVPVVGEYISGPPNMYEVVRVMHGWANGGPVAAVYVAPPQQAHTFDTSQHINPLQP